MDDEEQDSSPFRTCFKKNVKECESFSCVSNAMFLPWPTFVFFLPWRSAGVARQQGRSDAIASNREEEEKKNEHTDAFTHDRVRSKPIDIHLLPAAHFFFFFLHPALHFLKAFLFLLRICTVVCLEII